jgi:ABC-2 type transport system permease protein
MENEMRRGRICGGFYFPSGMERDIKKGCTVHPVLYKNAQNILVGNYLSKEGLSILRTFNAGVLIKKLKMKGLSEQQALAIVNPVATDVSVLYNANFNYTGFLCPGLIFAQFQVIVMLSALLVMTRACERHELQCSPGGTPCTPGALLIGKTLPYFGLHCLTGMGIVLILFPVFDIKLPGAFSLTCGLMMLYIAASFVPGLIIGLIVPNSIFGAQVGILVNMPAFIFSGYTFPLSAIPTPLAHLSQILPFTHFVPAFFKLSITRAPIASASAELAALVAFIVPTLPLVYGLLCHENRKASTISSFSTEGL